MTTTAAVKRLTNTPGRPSVHLVRRVTGDTDEMTRTDVRWVIDFLEAEALRYATDTNSPEGWTVERHLRHWRRVLASIDAYEGVAA
jgi:hypothetical protein